MKRVLFVCTGNRARSQMAEGVLRYLAGDRFEVHSAGTKPKGPGGEAVEGVREIGVDIRGQRSKHVEEYAGRPFDYVITVCDSARQSCPVFPGGGERIHWDVEDPLYAELRGESTVQALRDARDELRTPIEGFLRTEPW